MFFFAVEFEFPVMLVKECNLGSAIYYNGFDKNVVLYGLTEHRLHPIYMGQY